MMEKIIEKINKLSWLADKDMQSSESVEEQNYYCGMSVAYEKCVEILEEYKTNYFRWIPVEEKLPKVNQRVLCFEKHEGIILIGKLMKATSNPEACWHDEFEHYTEVVAWMPLPKKYKKA